jgi:hypothetical protein
VATNFLHGVETVEVNSGPVPIQLVKTAVIGLVGIAPVWQFAQADQSINQPVLILNDQLGTTTFGTEVDGYTIPQALQAISDQQVNGQGSGAVIVVNVFDPSVHKSSIAAKPFTFDITDKISLGEVGIANLVVKNQAGATTYAVGTDYTLDPIGGVITRVATGTIPAGAQVQASFDYADPSKVTAADIIGAVNLAGQRTGMQCFLDCANDFGFKPKLLIAPGYSQMASVAVAMDVMAQALRGICFVDAPLGTTFQQAIEGRGPNGSIAFDTSSERTVLCYPYVQIFDQASNAYVLEPYSQRLAGVTAATDLAFGYWYSPSNKEIQGITGIEIKLTASINDPNSEVNILNEEGICTIFNAYGTGLRAWGNRSSAWPTETAPKNFICIRRVADVIADSIEQSSLQFVDLPITNGQIDAVVESVNSFLRTLVGRGALIDGKCSYVQANNPATELALGHITFNYSFMPPPPMERITYEALVDINMLNELGSTTYQQGS